MKKKKIEFQAIVFLNKAKDLLTKYYPSFLIFGEETYLKDEVLKILRQKYENDSSKDFDSSLFFGDETTGAEIVEQLEMSPFIADIKCVIVKEFHKLKANDMNIIADYLKDPFDSSILFLVGDKVDGRTGSGKIIKETSFSIECKSPYGARDIVNWLRGKAKQDKISIDYQTMELFANSVENDYLSATNEWNKLQLFAGKSKNITYEHVKQSVGNLKGHNIFELQNNLGKADLKKSILILENMLDNDENVIYIVSMLLRFFLIIWKVNALRKLNISDSEIVEKKLSEVFWKFRSDYLLFANNYPVTSLRNVFALLLILN